MPTIAYAMADMAPSRDGHVHAGAVTVAGGCGACHEITVDAECATIDGYGEFYTLPAWTGDGTMPYVVLLNPKILGGSQWKVIAESNSDATDQGVIVQPPVAASWTQVNFAGGTSLTDVGTSLPGVNLYDTTTGANVTRAITRPLSGNYTITARLRPMIVPFLSPPGGGSSVSVCVSSLVSFWKSVSMHSNTM